MRSHFRTRAHLATALALALLLQPFRSVYSNECKTETHDVLSMICGAMGDFSGEKEAEWKRNVTSQLEAIRKDLDALRQGQQRIDARMSTLVEQNKTLLSEVSSLVTVGAAQSAMTDIRARWNSYQKLFRSTDSFL